MEAEQQPLELKPAKTFQEQVKILTSRGLFIDSEDSAIQTLSELNYYRLRGYYIHLQQPGSDQFIRGTSLEQIVALHQFDSRLRGLVLALLLDAEIVFRTRLAYEMGMAWGPIGYKDESNYAGCNHEQFEKVMGSIEKDIAQSTERFVKTHQQKYGGQFPIWVVVELMSFGDLSKMYSLLPPQLRKQIAGRYKHLDEMLLKNWLQAATLARNTCAHNSRIYGKPFAIPIQIENDVKMRIQDILESAYRVYPNSFFAYILAFRRISRPEAWNCFLEQFKNTTEQFDGIVELSRIGFPRQWKQILLPKK